MPLIMTADEYRVRRGFKERRFMPAAQPYVSWRRRQHVSCFKVDLVFCRRPETSSVCRGTWRTNAWLASAWSMVTANWRLITASSHRGTDRPHPVSSALL